MTTHGRSGTTSTSEVGWSSSTGAVDGGAIGPIVPHVGRRRRSPAPRPAGRLVGSFRRPYDRTAMAVGSRPLVPSSLAPGGLVPGHASVRNPRTRIGGFVALTKPRIVELLLITTLPTMVLAEGGIPPLRLIVA